MATPILEKVSLDLSYKLQDPVSTGTSPGKRLTAAERLRYIISGYRRLLRLVTLLAPELTDKMFKNYHLLFSGTTNLSGIITLPNAEIFDVYAKQPNEEDYIKVTYINASLYRDISTEQNQFYKPDLNLKQYYWTIIEDDLYILPAVRYNIQVIYRPDTASLLTYGGTTDIDIPTEFIDLLTSLSAVEAYIDIGQLDIVQALKTDVTEQISILANVKKEKEQKDEI